MEIQKIHIDRFGGSSLFFFLFRARLGEIRPGNLLYREKGIGSIVRENSF